MPPGMRRRAGPVSTTAGLIFAGTLAVLAAALLLFWPGRGGRSEGPRAAAAAPDAYAPVLPGLCRSSAAVSSGDVAGADRVFADTIHGPLHDIAREAGAEDRVMAARVLEAKQAVEQELERSQPDPGVLGPNIDRLISTTRTALALTGHPSAYVCASPG